MAIFVDENTKVMYQGLTGSQGRFYGLRNRDYGTQVVAGVNPKKAGTDVDGIPVYASVAEAKAATGATVSCVFIPAPGVKAAVLEAAEAGMELVVVITEGVPAQDEAYFFNKVKRDFPGTRILGPNCPGIISPGKANIGITAGEIALAGGPVGIVSRSGTLTYQALYELKLQGIGVTTCVGIGGDPVPGTSFIDCLEAFEADPETKAVMLIGEIGGSAEEEAAEFIKNKMPKPVSVLFSTFTVSVPPTVSTNTVSSTLMCGWAPPTWCSRVSGVQLKSWLGGGMRSRSPRLSTYLSEPSLSRRQRNTRMSCACCPIWNAASRNSGVGRSSCSVACL
ncbi:MAG TPA: CoA-binding protein [Acidimicrobiales bacterium]|nr:CoA-binding protein [Acidimicrobiales bacterium]